MFTCNIIDMCNVLLIGRLMCFEFLGNFIIIIMAIANFNYVYNYELVA